MVTFIKCVCVLGKQKIFQHSNIFSRSCSTQLRQVMRTLPQPVIVVASAMVHPIHGVLKRGVTCSSFTSVSMNPAVVSVSIFKGNLINSIIEKSNLFATNILSDKQLKFGMHFAKSLNSEFEYNQFEGIEHSDGTRGIPILEGCVASLHCQVTKADYIGDHLVWYGEVLHTSTNPDCSLHPMIYYRRCKVYVKSEIQDWKISAYYIPHAPRSFRSIGDEIFMQAFEDTVLPFEEWTHEAHLRMAWNYITEFGHDKAIFLVKEGIQKLNDKNKAKIKHGYSETVTLFYMHILTKAILSMPSNHTFEEFLLCHNYLRDPKYIFTFYSQKILNNPKSKLVFMEPDLKPIA